MHGYFSFCSTSAVSPVIQTHFTVKCTSNTTAQTETGAKILRVEAFVCIIVRPQVCFGALLVAKALQNCFSMRTKELLPKIVCTRAKRENKNLDEAFLSSTMVLNFFELRLNFPFAPSNNTWLLCNLRTIPFFNCRLMDRSYSKFRILTPNNQSVSIKIKNYLVEAYWKLLGRKLKHAHL